MINKQKTNWVIDVVLFSGFVIAFYLDWTGLELHQWLGIGLGLLAGYHLLAHWKWVASVTQRFSDSSCGKNRLRYLVDAGLFFGFLTIVGTGLLISSWLNLSLDNYSAWKNLHISASLLTLLGLIWKIGLHWKWILTTIQPLHTERPVQTSQPGLTPRPVSNQATIGRAEFLKLMGTVSLAALLAGTRALDGLEDQIIQVSKLETDSQVAPAVTQQAPVTPEALNLTASTTTSIPAATATSARTGTTSAACTVRCNRGCSYPGHCRKYTDANGNGRCDWGECL